MATEPTNIFTVLDINWAGWLLVTALALTSCRLPGADYDGLSAFTNDCDLKRSMQPLGKGSYSGSATCEASVLSVGDFVYILENRDLPMPQQAANLVSSEAIESVPICGDMIVLHLLRADDFEHDRTIQGVDCGDYE